jgi:hypothetical protein
MHLTIGQHGRIWACKLGVSAASINSTTRLVKPISTHMLKRIALVSIAAIKLENIRLARGR